MLFGWVIRFRPVRHSTRRPDVLVYLYALKEDGSGKVVRLIRASNNLGAYLIGCFPKWADGYGNAVSLVESEAEPSDDEDGRREIWAS
jgi:hypothetical protein